MNKKICVGASYVLCIVVAIFFVLQVASIFVASTFLAMSSFAVCIVLSWAFLIVTAGHAKLADDDRKIAAEAGKLFAVIYSVFICLVYFTQLSVVFYRILPEEIITAMDFNARGSWLFVIDIVGYGIMAISTLFTGLSLKPLDKSDKILKAFFLIHGVFSVSTILPLTPVFLNSNGSSGNGGCIALAIWCLVFFPIPLLSLRRFKNSNTI